MASMAVFAGRRVATVLVPVAKGGRMRCFSKEAEESASKAFHVRLEARIEDTLKEMMNEGKNSKKTGQDLDVFLKMIRRGSNVSNDDILSFAKLFNDELTLDNISRPRLFNMCKYMSISPFGDDDGYLRYILRKKLQTIKEHDKLIQEEGVESLSEAELREDCRERGMLGLLSVEEMRQQLRDWLNLSLNHSVPSSLLILSRTFTVSGKLKLKPEEVVGATISSLPDEVVDTVKAELERKESARLELADIVKEMVKLVQNSDPNKVYARLQSLENKIDDTDAFLKKNNQHFLVGPVLGIALNSFVDY